MRRFFLLYARIFSGTNNNVYIYIYTNTNLKLPAFSHFRTRTHSYGGGAGREMVSRVRMFSLLPPPFRWTYTRLPLLPLFFVPYFRRARLSLRGVHYFMISYNRWFRSCFFAQLFIRVIFAAVYLRLYFVFLVYVIRSPPPVRPSRYPRRDAFLFLSRAFRLRPRSFVNVVSLS